MARDRKKAKMDCLQEKLKILSREMMSIKSANLRLKEKNEKILLENQLLKQKLQMDGSGSVDHDVVKSAGVEGTGLKPDVVTSAFSTAARIYKSQPCFRVDVTHQLLPLNLMKPLVLL